MKELFWKDEDGLGIITSLQKRTSRQLSKG